jgi:predicted nuclease of predicted toxin-antitoxin system
VIAAASIEHVVTGPSTDKSAVVALLAAAGHDAVAVRDLGLANVPHNEILDRGLVDDRVITSHDVDLGTLLAVRPQVKLSCILIRRPTS